MAPLSAAAAAAADAYKGGGGHAVRLLVVAFFSSQIIVLQKREVHVEELVFFEFFSKTASVFTRLVVAKECTPTRTVVRCPPFVRLFYADIAG